MDGDKMARHHRMLRLAKKIAGLSQHPRFKVGAIVARGDHIVSLGVNKLKSHPRQINAYTGRHGASIHAELAAVIGISEEKLLGTTVYIARKLADNSTGLSKPCKFCYALLKEVGVKRVVWTTQTGFEEERVR